MSDDRDREGFEATGDSAWLLAKDDPHHPDNRRRTPLQDFGVSFNDVQIAVWTDVEDRLVFDWALVESVAADPKNPYRFQAQTFLAAREEGRRQAVLSP